MQVAVIEAKENPFLNRKELVVELKHPAEATPSKAELIKELALSQGVDKSQIQIDYIFTKKGIAESFAKVKIFKEKPKIAEGEKSETQTSQAA